MGQRDWRFKGLGVVEREVEDLRVWSVGGVGRRDRRFEDLGVAKVEDLRVRVGGVGQRNRRFESEELEGRAREIGDLMVWGWARRGWRFKGGWC